RYQHGLLGEGPLDMRKATRSVARAQSWLSLMLLCVFSAAANAENVWVSSFGQGWFNESASGVGTVVAGTWSESALEPSSTYTIAFNVQRLSGAMNLFVGNLPAITIDKVGAYAFDFTVTDAGRKMIFTAGTSDVTASVNQIAVSQKPALSAETMA